MDKNEITLEEMFKKECKIIDLFFEYDGFDGTEKYAIISDLSQTQLNDKYGEILNKYKPYIILNANIGIVFNDYFRNENKHNMRNIRSCEPLGYKDGQTEINHPESILPSFEDKWILSEDLKQAMKTLTVLERKRIIARFFECKKLQEIADEYGCSARAVKYSIDSALKKIKKKLE